MTDVVDRVRSVGVVPVVVIEDASLAVPLGDSLKAAGLPLAEVTFRTAAAEDALHALAADPALLVGAGTVLDVDQVDRVVDAGARFIVSPGLRGSVVRRAQELDVEVWPGVATPTEVLAASSSASASSSSSRLVHSAVRIWSRRWPARSRPCGSSPPEESHQPTSATTWRSDRWSRSVVHGWSRRRYSHRATSPASAVSAHRRWRGRPGHERADTAIGRELPLRHRLVG